MYRSEVIYFIVLVIITLASHFVPTNILLVLDHIVVRVAIVLLLLYLINIGPTIGIFGLVAIGVLYLERNRRKISVANSKFDQMEAKERPATVEEEAIPQKTVPVHEFDTPIPTESDFIPHHIDDMFEPVAPSINQKEVLAGVYPLSEVGSASVTTDLYEKMGFAPSL
jgi:hypothetical protein